MTRLDRKRNPFEQAQTTTAMVSDQTAVELYYDYSTVPEEHREILRRSAMTIKPRLKRAAEDIFVIGRELMTVKARLPHGTYTNWLDIEFGLSDRMAQRFMSVSERLGGKSDIMSGLPPTTLYLLAAPSTPDDAIATVEQQLANGERISVSYVQQVIMEAKQRANDQRVGDMMIDGEVIHHEDAGREMVDRKTTVQRLEKVFATVIELLGGTTGEDWVALFHTNELKHLHNEASRLQQILQRIQ